MKPRYRMTTVSNAIEWDKFLDWVRANWNSDAKDKQVHICVDAYMKTVGFLK